MGRVGIQNVGRTARAKREKAKGRDKNVVEGRNAKGARDDGTEFAHRLPFKFDVKATGIIVSDIGFADHATVEDSERKRQHEENE